MITRTLEGQTLCIFIFIHLHNIPQVFILSGVVVASCAVQLALQLQPQTKLEAQKRCNVVVIIRKPSTCSFLLI